MKRRLLAALASLWLICAVAFAVRAAFLWHEQRIISHRVLAEVPFAQETGSIAASLTEGAGFSNVFRRDTGPTAWLTPVYPLLLAAVFKIFGAFTFPAFVAAALLNCLFSALACIPIFLLGKKLAGLPAATLAAWLWAVYPHAILIPTEWIWDTSLSALLAACFLWATLALADSSRPRAWTAYGLLWGFTLLTNPALGAAMPFFFAWLSCRRCRASTPFWQLPALALLVATLCCIPWTIRNYSAFHRFIPLRSNFAFELWLGNNDIFDPHAVHGIQRITRFEQTRRYSQLGEIAFMQEKWNLATDFIRTHPALEVRLIARRVVATWFGTESPLSDFRASDSWLVRGILFCNFFVTLAAAAGLILLIRRRHPFAFPLAVFPLVFPMVYYITHTSLRYRHPADPVLIILVAFAISKLLRIAPRSPATQSPAIA